MSGSVFEQHFHGPVENVYNVNGDLILSKSSTAPDLARELKTLRAQVAELPKLDAPAKETTVKAVDAAIEEAQKPKPQKIEIQKHLDTAASTIEKTQGVADKGLKLAETLLKIGKWAAVML